MNSSVEKIMSQVLELEGLLLVADNHNGDVNPIVFKLIHEKASAINEMAQDIDASVFNPVEEVPADIDWTESPEINNEDPDAEEPQPEEAVDGIEDETHIDDASEEVKEAPIDSDLEFIDNNESLHDSEEEPKEIWVSEFTEPEVENHVDEVFDNQDVDPDSEEENPEEVTDNDSLNDSVFDQSLPEEDFNQDNEIDEESDIENEEESFDKEQEEEEDNDVNLEDEPNEDAFDEPIKLDAALQRNMSKNLARAFSLNDRFRYRRELFANSDVEMKNTLDLVETMQSYSEAEDYFYGDLEWDRNSEEVKDFMEIIRNHFL